MAFRAQFWTFLRDEVLQTLKLQQRNLYIHFQLVEVAYLEFTGFINFLIFSLAGDTASVLRFMRLAPSASGTRMRSFTGVSSQGAADSHAVSRFDSPLAAARCRSIRNSVSIDCLIKCTPRLDPFHSIQANSIQASAVPPHWFACDPGTLLGTLAARLAGCGESPSPPPSPPRREWDPSPFLGYLARSVCTVRIHRHGHHHHTQQPHRHRKLRRTGPDVVVFTCSTTTTSVG